MLRQASEGGIAAAHAMAMASAIRPALCWRGMSTDIEELRGEIIALETALASAFGELAVLRASI